MTKTSQKVMTRETKAFNAALEAAALELQCKSVCYHLRADAATGRKHSEARLAAFVFDEAVSIVESLKRLV